MSGVACHHRLWAAHTVGRRGAWHDITALGQHIQSATTSGVACNDRLRAAQTVERCRAWHAIIALGRQTPSTASGVACHHRLWATQTVERCRAWHAIIALEWQTRYNDVRHDMSSPPLDSTHGRMTPSVACHHRIWAAKKVERRQAWHAIIAFGQHTRSNDVGRGMISSPLD